MMDLNVNGYTVLVELTDDAETHYLLDYISYLNNIFKEKESTANATFVTNNMFSKTWSSKTLIFRILEHLPLYIIRVL